jgi:preprotein translocase subunit SecG
MIVILLGFVNFGENMVAFTILIVLILAVGGFMAVAILMQNPKGGGLSGAFGGAGSSFGTMLGVRHASDILQKSTWWLAGIFVALILIVNLFFLPTGLVEESAIQKASQEQPMSPMPQQGQQPGAQPGAQPGTQPGAQPGTQPGAQPGMQPGTQPATQPPPPPPSPGQ